MASKKKRLTDFFAFQPYQKGQGRALLRELDIAWQRF